MKKSRPLKSVVILAIIAILVLLIPSTVLSEQTAWDCPECGRTGNTGNFCGGCAHPSPLPAERISVEIGSIIRFGNYEQDNNTNNGKEPIEWIVLDCNEAEGKALLISKYGLDAKPYNAEYENTIWEQCTLRNWLNREFLNKAFDAEERSAILTTEVNNSQVHGYSKWKTDGGNNTQDQIFLLSYLEAKEYFGLVSGNGDKSCCVAPTQYAISQGAFKRDNSKTSEGKSIGWWWLRSPGDEQNNAAHVSYVGSLVDTKVNYRSGSVRPAFWMNLYSAAASKIFR